MGECSEKESKEKTKRGLKRHSEGIDGIEGQIGKMQRVREYGGKGRKT